MDKFKFQWSKKLDNGEIFVVKGDKFDELVLDIEEIEAYLQIQKNNEGEITSISYDATSPVSNPQFSSGQPKSQYLCNICGKPASLNEGTSKAGNHYKILKCSAFPELTTKGGHSTFLK